ncbi:MAG: histidine kinase [Roseivirga sp.]|nr:histidine kinase [Roseivirga sp.]
MNSSNTPSLLDRFLARRVLTHTLFWIAMLLLYSRVLFHTQGSFWYSFLNNIVLFPPIIGASYFLTYYQIPRYIYKKKYWQFAVSFIISIYVFTVLARMLTVYVSEPLLGIDRPFPGMWAIVLVSIDRLIQNYFFTIALGASLMATVKILKQHLEERQKAERLEKEKHVAELNFLKAQIHPHFLFNTLNNLYTLTLQKSDLAPTTVIKLSEMLDYMLYQCNDKQVPIHKEIKLLNNYIDLERLRYGDRLEFSFDQQIDKPETPIAPLILLSLVENAFKHGASAAIRKPRIEIHIGVKDNVLKARVFNTKPEKVQADPARYKEGIGVSNIKRQLELIYPGAYSLEITEKEGYYSVDLEIQLAAL